MTAKRIAIVGSRNWTDIKTIQSFIEKLALDTTIVSGGAKGVDSIAESIAHGCNLKTLIFLPDWKKHGRAAGFIRNKLIIENADEVVAFWDGLSKGTSHSIKLAKTKGIPTKIIGENNNAQKRNLQSNV